jgi:uncharacterized protein
MRLEQSFEVRAPLERVWETLIDVQRVAPCLPGAEIDEAVDEGTYRGSFDVRLGPATAAYRGELTLAEIDPDAHRSVLRASGRDKRGQGTAKATIVSVLSPAGDATKVDVETDFTITGRLASFGRGGMIQDISARLLRDFADCLQHTIESDQAAGPVPPEPAGAEPATPVAASPPAPPTPRPPAAKPVGGFSLLLRALLDRLRRVFARRG